MRPVAPGVAAAASPAAADPANATDDPTMPHNPAPRRTEPLAERLDGELDALLAEPFASAWAQGDRAPASASPALRGRLLERLAASRAASAVMFTSRRARLAAVERAPGVIERTLYAAPGGRALRRGEPLRARLIELGPGARWHGPDATQHREWLVLRGSARIGNEALRPRDYHVAPAQAAQGVVGTRAGALLFLRESTLPAGAGAGAGAGAYTVRDDAAAWPDYAPGIKRRVLWQHDGQAAMLYQAEPGASVPLHSHGHDEECLMLLGELFLDDELLRAGDYQLAPAGSAHHTTATDTGVVIFAHGDLDLNFAA